MKLHFVVGSCAIFRSYHCSPRNKFAIATAMVLACLSVVGSAQAQIQRSFVNLGFERPYLGTVPCVSITSANEVPGWDTTESTATPADTGCNAYTAVGASNNEGTIELWANGFGNDEGWPVNSAEGTQHAELNAYSPARLSQDVCLISGETIGYSMSHRGRESRTVGDVAEFNIDASTTTNIVVEPSTTYGGTGGITQCGGTSYMALQAGPVNGASSGFVISPTCTSVLQTVPGNGASGWRQYTGSFGWGGSTGIHNVGFTALSTSNNAISEGNFLDAVNLTLVPVIEFASATYTSVEGQPSVQPDLIVVGTVPAGGIPVTVSIVAGGTASQGTDFNLGTFTIPAGIYETPTLVPMTGLLSITDDPIIEDNESFTLNLDTSPNYVVSSTATCGAAGQATTTYSIVDNDLDLATTNVVSNSMPPVGSAVTYTVTFTNNTAAPITAPMTSRDVSAEIADTAPAGITFTGWSCTATAFAQCPGGTVNGSTSGSGDISGLATLPAGGSSGGGMLTFSITAAVSTCGASLSSTSTIATPTGFAEGSSVQTGFASPIAGGTANNAATASLVPICRAIEPPVGGVPVPIDSRWLSVFLFLTIASVTWIEVRRRR